MGKLIDLTNQKFGLWTVLYKVPKNQSGSNWMCRCECGKEKIINGYNLRKGKTTNCGCTKGKQLGKNNIIGAGATVIKNIEEEGCTFVGIPVKKLIKTK